MKNTDKRIDSYINKSSDFAKPILIHIRNLVHKVCPDVQEKIKWGMPFFDYQNEMLCNMAAFKNHCSFGFWKASLMKDFDKIFSVNNENGMGHFGKICKLSDLPSDKIISSCINEAMKLNDEGRKSKIFTKEKKKDLQMPDYFRDALMKSPQLTETFDKFSLSNKREYIEWLTEAKSETTRNKRLQTALEWISDGKPRNWKYMKKYSGK
ncbi:MAG TPA: DUF1801 domain-containing protein [Ignavibacteria bacterium]|nr:DUF1801 domain-containing protein [Ignavibacteria bacterium]HRB00620.1 DUF1801 domain-containing protein [Ignavibacteria bacterium]